MADRVTERRCPLWVKILLGLSLAANLAIAGLVGGIALRGGPLGGKGPGVGYALPYVLALPHQHRRTVFGAIRGNADLPGRGARRAAYRDMIALLQAEAFDRAAVSDVLERQARDVGQVQMVAQTAWLDTVAGMTQEERSAYATRLTEVVSRGGRERPGERN